MIEHYNFALCSIKARPLLSTMTLFIPTYISLPTAVINVMKFSDLNSFENVYHLNHEVNK